MSAVYRDGFIEGSRFHRAYEAATPDRASAEGLREDQRARIVPLDRACGTSYTCVFASGHDGLHSFEQFAVERAALATPDRADPIRQVTTDSNPLATPDRADHIEQRDYRHLGVEGAITQAFEDIRTKVATPDRADHGPCTCGPWTVEGDPIFRTSRGSWHKASCSLHLATPDRADVGNFNPVEVRDDLGEAPLTPGGMPKCETCGDIAYRPDPVAGRQQAWRCGGCHYTIKACKCATPDRADPPVVEVEGKDGVIHRVWATPDRPGKERAMSSGQDPAFLASTPDTLGGDVRFDGTRIGLRTVLGALRDASKDQVEEMYPNLPHGWYDLVLALRPYLRRTHRRSVR